MREAPPLAARLRGHYWTLRPFVRSTLVPPRPPASTQVTVEVVDERFGAIRLSGRLSDHASSQDLLVVVHGLGGSAASSYAVRAASAGYARGVSVLRFNMRGADRRGDDFFHAGLTSDLRAMLAAPALARFRRVMLLGYSLGGHLVLRLLSETHDPRIASAAAICSPLDLSRTADALDGPRVSLYRRHVLAGLLEMYRSVAARREVPLDVARAARITRIREWDDLIVAPRHGFDGAEDYYRRASVGPHLHRIRTPALVLHTAEDPMVPLATVRDALAGSHTLDWHAIEGGHVGFPPTVRLGHAHGPDLERLVVDWLLGRGEVGATSLSA